MDRGLAPHSRLAQEIDRLKRRVAEMGAVAEAMVATSAMALVERKRELRPHVLKQEEALDRMQVEIDADAIRLMTIFSPAAMDLRFLLMAARITSELERIGDQAVNNCEYVEWLRADPPIRVDLPRMLRLARDMVHGALEAFQHEDIGRARQVLKADDEVDALNGEICQELLRRHVSDADGIACSMGLVLAARSLERIADHATNISEEVIYLIQAEDVRHRDSLRG